MRGPVDILRTHIGEMAGDLLRYGLIALGAPLAHWALVCGAACSGQDGTLTSWLGGRANPESPAALVQERAPKQGKCRQSPGPSGALVQNIISSFLLCPPQFLPGGGSPGPEVKC